MPAGTSRPTHSARFIAADAAAVRVPLGADGKLPELVLVDLASPKEEEEAAKKKTTPPWLLLVVFGFSVTASVAMLFIDSSGPVIERQSKAKARESLQKYYAGSKMPLATHQQKVRLALQAYQRGDRDAERRFYREVLDILHAESKNKFTGITGMVDSPDPPVGNPSDRHLESLISVLLAD